MAGGRGCMAGRAHALAAGDSAATRPSACTLLIYPSAAQPRSVSALSLSRIARVIPFWVR